MMNNTFRFSYKPVLKTQQLLIHEWIAQPHINEWLHGDGLKNTIEDLNNFVQNKQTRSTHWIAYDKDIPFAYLITSDIEKTNEEPKTAITLDLFICRLDYIGKGLSVKMIHEFLLSQFPNIDEVLIDPEMSNTRAIHVYQKAGFKIIGEFIASWHPVPHYKMGLNIGDLKKNPHFYSPK